MGEFNSHMSHLDVTKYLTLKQNAHKTPTFNKAFS